MIGADVVKWLEDGLMTKASLLAVGDYRIDPHPLIIGGY